MGCSASKTNTNTAAAAAGATPSRPAHRRFGFKKSAASRRAAFERKQASFVTYHVGDPAFADLHHETRPVDFSKTWDIDYTRIVLRPADFRIRSLLHARLSRAAREAKQ